jgi:diketogulonate reductase-like aldo/keto reductase
VKREDIFITTKVWPHLSEPEDVEWSLRNSLEMLGTEYVDAFLIHWPFAAEKTERNEVKLGADGKVCSSPEASLHTADGLSTSSTRSSQRIPSPSGER